MYMNLRSFTYWCSVKAWLLSLVLTACTDTEDVSMPDGIAFGVSTDAEGRAATLIGEETEDAFRAQPFAVFGDWKDTEAGPTLEEVFDNVSVAYDGKAPAPSGWNYTPVQRWKTNGWYDFRAYWPATNPIENTSNAQTLALEYNMQTQNEDLMVAYRGCLTRSNPVGLSFRHALAAVAVKFMTDNTTYTYWVKNVYFNNLYYTGTLPYNSKEATPDLTTTWQYAARSTENIRLREWTSDTGVQAEATADGYPEDFNLFLPQSLQVGESEAKPSITFTIDVRSGDTTIDTPTITVALPDTDGEGNAMWWQAGKKYTYVITIKPEAFDITVRTTEWDEVDVTVGDINFQ